MRGTRGYSLDASVSRLLGERGLEIQFDIYTVDGKRGDA
jgi:hypothetical protein